MAGPNTFKGKAGEAEPILELAAGDEIVIVPIMSAVRPTGPRIQVPAILADDIGVVEMDVVSDDEGAEGLEDILTLTELGDEASSDDPDGDEVDTVRLSPDSPDDSSPSNPDDRKEPPIQAEPPSMEQEADEETTLPDLDLPDELDSALDDLFGDESDSTPNSSSQLQEPVQAAWHVISHAGGAA